MSPDFAIRRAAVDEAAAVRDLTRRANARWVPVVGSGPMTADRDRALRHHGIDVTMADGAWAGLIETAPTASHLLVESVGPRPRLPRPVIRALPHDPRRGAGDRAGLVELRLYTTP